MEVDLFVTLSLLLGMLIEVDKRVGFRDAIADEEYVFSYARSRAKHGTPSEMVTRIIEKIFKISRKVLS